MSTLLTNDGSDRARWRWASVAAIGITLIAMSPICRNDFLWWDDQGTIHHNPLLNPLRWHSILSYWTTSQQGLYLPVTGMAWMAIASFSRVQPDAFDIALNPWFFHAASVLVHLFSVVFVIRIFRTLNATPLAGLLGALVFAIHPLQVESIAWASGLKDLLAGMFSLMAVSQYIHFAIARRDGQAWVKRFVIATICFQLAMLSKASAMTLPLVVLVIDRWAIERPWRDIFPSVVAWLLLAIPIGICAMIVQDAINTPKTPLWFRPLIVCDSLVFYLYKFIWPLNLTVDYGRNPAAIRANGWVWWDWTIPVAIGISLYIGRKRRPILLAAAAVAVMAMLPTLGFTRTLYQFYTTVADHYVYVAMLGPALAVAWVVSIDPTLISRSLTVIALAAFGVLSFRQTFIWQTDTTLFEHAIKANPVSIVAHGNLGSAYAQTGRLTDAARLFHQAILIRPDFALSYSNYGHALADLGDIDGAIAADQQSVAMQIKANTLRQSWVRDNRQLGELMLKKKRYVEAEAYFREAAEQAPESRPIYQQWLEAHRLAHMPATTQSTTAPSIEH